MLIEALIKQSGMNDVSLEWLALTASKRYKTYDIPKRNGATRTIHHPSKSIKSIQRWVSKFLLRRLPVHVAAQAYVRGASIRKNAELHAGSKFTLRIDFSDFFPSFSREHVELFLAAVERDRSIGLTNRDISFLSRIVSRHGQLTIGAPSSPILTNAMMHFFDSQIAEFADRKNLIYTRYADDLFFSSNKPDNLTDVLAIVQQVSATYPYANLRINPDKTVFLSRRYSRRVTGLVLTTDGKVSIGRARKRAVKAQVHKLIQGEFDNFELPTLRGYLAFIQDVEPEFWESLKSKYGADAMLTVVGKQHFSNLL
ncbi:retron St85 family RNA-directed DNA polymerase [Rhizobium sp. NFACC06-2]|uniref:retron St85 family RNA-directed DNA polymerase n=1 Tax=Rhizobium sp. NFACC06-2 TaxID=1566264 RepID=UPI000876F1CF|nr:retron St85 family RNA-directed DNA polymerase [Rhizobium sp. NFACC06-2]SCY81635.1 Retron-type reverse transcriptase [Rhizobium sp. NFACC06-2]